MPRSIEDSAFVAAIRVSLFGVCLFLMSVLTHSIDRDF